MERDPAVCVFGEDIGVAVSNVTTGLLKRFGPDRVIDMPISEQAFTSFATGAAMAGPGRWSSSRSRRCCSWCSSRSPTRRTSSR